MLALKSEASEDLTSLLAYSTISAAEELESWTRLEFDEMDRDSSTNNRNRARTGESSGSSANNSTGAHSQPMSANNIEDAALLAQFAAAAGNLGQDYSNMLPHNSYPSMGPTPGFYGNFMHHGSMPPPQLPPLSALDFPWPPMMPHQGPDYDLRHAHASSSTAQPFLDTQSSSAQPPAGTRESRRGRQPSSSSAQLRTSTSPEVEQETDRLAISDEKRRRNTAASARFRIKKKHKTITLERSVTELTGRADELEREAADLRRENGWLKEIVMLKGTRFAANNFAARQQAAAGLVSQEAGPSSTSRGQDEDSPAEEESESSEEEAPQKKGKGKKPPKNT